MATAPQVPVFPGTHASDGLKLSTRVRIASRRGRLKARPVPAVPMAITQYDAAAHGLDFLFFWWMTCYAMGEHLDMFGPVASSPMGFLKAYAADDIMVMHEQGDQWQQWNGIVAVFWSSNMVEGVRYCLDYWIGPAYRHPSMSAQIAQGVLKHLFSTRGFSLVWGITPVKNRLAIRFLNRLGFSERQFWPGGSLDPHTGQAIAAVVTHVRRDAWLEREASHGGQ